MLRYSAIGAVLMSKKVVDGICQAGFWRHGHTYQVVVFFFLGNFSRVLTPIVGASDFLRRVSGRSKSHQGESTTREVPNSRKIPLFFAEKTIAGPELDNCPSDI